MEQDQKKKKKRGLLRFSKDPEPDEMVIDTLGELKDIVGSMRDVFQDFEKGYSKQLEEERSGWQKIESKLPKMLQTGSTKSQEERMGRIKNNKENLTSLEDNLSKLELVLASGSSSNEAITQAYLQAASGGKSSDKAVEDLEKRMKQMQEDLTNSMSEMTAQISLIKSALDNMAGQLDEHGVKLEGIDGKIDTIDTKLDKAHEMLKKIATKINNNRIIALAVVGGIAAIILSNVLK